MASEEALYISVMWSGSIPSVSCFYAVITIAVVYKIVKLYFFIQNIMALWPTETAECTSQLKVLLFVSVCYADAAY
jgi:hypothetical protein